MKTGTLCFLVKGDRILLAMKKRGFGEGKWNGYGGKVEPEESLETAAMREVLEEANVVLDKNDIEARGKIIFRNPPGSDDFEVHIFVARQWQGEPEETEEMKPKWFGFPEIPFEHMWPSDKFWLPKLLEGRMISAEIFFDKTGKDIEKMDLKEL